MMDGLSCVPLGVVVIGVGIAGRVRIRDISQSSTDGDCRWKLIAYVSRRQIDIEGATQITEEEALTHPEVQAVLVCTEPGAHEDVIRKALGHGKHVLVEFPVVSSLASTKELYQLASEKGLVLHEENIALLTQSFMEIKEKLKITTSQVTKVDLKLSGSYNGYVEDFARSGGPFVVNVSLIQTLYELFGEDLRATAGQVVMDDQGFTAMAKLTTSGCSDLNIEVRRTKEKSRRLKTLRIELADGSVIEDSPEKPVAPPTSSSGTEPKKPGLFMQDFLMFMSEVYKKRDWSRDRDKVIHCMAVAEQIHNFMGLKSAI